MFVYFTRAADGDVVSSLTGFAERPVPPSWGWSERPMRCFASCCGDCWARLAVSARIASLAWFLDGGPGRILRGSPSKSGLHDVHPACGTAPEALRASLAWIRLPGKPSSGRCSRCAPWLRRRSSSHPLARAAPAQLRAAARRGLPHGQRDRGVARHDVRRAAQAPAASLVAAPAAGTAVRRRSRCITRPLAAGRPTGASGAAVGVAGGHLSDGARGDGRRRRLRTAYPNCRLRHCDAGGRRAARACCALKKQAGVHQARQGAGPLRARAGARR